MGKQSNKFTEGDLSEFIRKGRELRANPVVLNQEDLTKQRRQDDLGKITSSSLSDDTLESYQDYDVVMTPYKDWNLQRAQNQGKFREASNAWAQMNLKILPMVVQNFAALGNIDQMFSASPEIESNALYDMMEDLNESIGEAFPIYRENPNETWNPGDSAWWAENIAGVGSSAAAFAISSYLTGNAIGGILRGAIQGGRVAQAALKGRDLAVAMRAGKILSQSASKAIGVTTNLLTAASANHIEGVGVALETGKIIRDTAIAEGKSLEEADQLASEGMALSYNWNRVNMAFNITSTGMFLSSPRHTRQLLTQMTIKNTAKKMGIEAVQEGIEESINLVSQKRGEAHGQGAHFGMNEIMETVMSEEGLSSAFWGAMGGAGQVSIASIKNAIPTPFNRNAEGQRQSKMAIHNQRYADQQELIKKYDTTIQAAGGPSISSAFMNMQELVGISSELEKAQNEGDEKKIQHLNETILEIQAANAFEMGTTDKLIERYNTIKNGEATEGMDNDPSSDTYYKKKAQEAVERIEVLEKKFLKAGQYINNKEVYGTMAKEDWDQRQANHLESKFNESKSTTYTALQKAQQEGDIKSTFTKESYGAELNESVPGIEVSNTELNTQDFEIVIDPTTLEVVEDPNIPSEIKDAVDAEIKATPEYAEFVNAEAEYVLAKGKLDATKKKLEILTSDEYQRGLMEQEKRDKAAEDQFKKDLEKDQVEDEKKTARKESKKVTTNPPVDPKNPTGVILEKTIPDDIYEGDPDPATSTTTEVAPEFEQIEEPATPDAFQGFEDETQGAKKEDIVPPPGVVEAGQFILSEERSEQEAVNEIYTEEDNRKVDEAVDKLDEKKEDKDKKVVNEDGSITYLGKKTKYAPNLLAYLARAYKNIISYSKEGKPFVKKEDVDNNLLETLDFDLITKTFEGEPVTLQKLDVDEIDGEPVTVYNPFYTKGGVEEKTITWKTLKARLKPEDYNKYVPIGAFIKGKTIPSAFIHSYDWINDANVSFKVKTQEQQQSELMEIRDNVVSQGTVTTNVIEKGDGELIRSAEGTQTSVAEAFPDEDMEIGVIRNSEFISSKPANPNLKDIVIVNMDQMANYQGMLVSLVPMRGESAKLGGNKRFKLVPLRRNKLSTEQVDSIINAIRLWYDHANNKVTNLHQKTMAELGEDYLYNFGALQKYLSQLIDLKWLENTKGVSDPQASMKDILSELSSKDGVKENIRMIGSDGAGALYLGLGGSSKIPYLHANTPANQVEATLDLFRKTLSEMHINPNMSIAQDEDFNLPIIANDGTVSRNKTTYKGFIKNNSTTNLMSFKDADGNYIYTIQHTLQFNTVTSKGIPFEPGTEVVTNAFGDEDSNKELAALEGQNRKVSVMGRVEGVEVTTQDFAISYPNLSKIDMDKAIVTEAYLVDDIAFVIRVSDGNTSAYIVAPEFQGAFEVSKEDIGEYTDGDDVKKMSLEEGQDAFNEWKEIAKDDIVNKIAQEKKLQSYEYTEGEVDVMKQVPSGNIVGNVKVIGYKKSADGGMVSIETPTENFHILISELLKYSNYTYLSDGETSGHYNPKTKEGSIHSDGISYSIKDGKAKASSISTDRKRAKEGEAKVKAFLAKMEKKSLGSAESNTVTHNNREYTVEGDKIFNKDGKEVYKKDNKNRRDILALTAPKEPTVEKKAKPVKRTIGGISLTIDMNKKGDEVQSDDLPSLDSSFEQETQELAEMLYTKGMTPNQSRALVSFVVNHINKVVQENAKQDKVTNPAPILREFFDLFEDLKKEAEESGLTEQAQMYGAAVENKKSFEQQLSNELARQSTLKDLDGDLINQYIATNNGADLSQKSFDVTDRSLTIDSKTTASSNIKRFLSGIQDMKQVPNEDGSHKLAPKTHHGGLPMYIDWDVAWNTIQGILLDSNPVLSEQIAVLEKHSEAHPWLNDVITKLNESGSAVGYEFASTMSKHAVNMFDVLYTHDPKTGWSLHLSPTNANTVGKQVNNHWARNAEGVSMSTQTIEGETKKEFLFVTSDDEVDEYVINEEVAQNLLDRYEGLKDDPDAAMEWLEDLGVELSDKTKNDLIESGLYYGYQERTFSDLFNRGGLFSNARSAIKDHMTKGTTLSRGELYSGSAMRALAVVEASNNPTYYVSSFRNGENKTISAAVVNKLLIDRVKDLKNDPELIKALSEMPFNESSTIVEEGLKLAKGKGSALINLLKPIYVGTLKEKDSRTRGITTDKSTDAQLEALRVGMLFNAGQRTGRGGSRVMNLIFPTTSDKKNAYAIPLLAHDTRLKANGEVSDSTIQHMYDKIVFPEISRILHANQNKGKFDVSAYEDGAGQFLILPELNAIEGLFEEGELYTSILDVNDSKGTKLREALKDKLAEYVKDAVQDKKAEWAKFGIGSAKDNWLDKDYMQKIAGEFTPSGVSKVDFAATDFIVNSMLGNTEIYKAFTGDPALYYKSKHVYNVAKANNVAMETMVDGEIAKRSISDVRTELIEMGKYGEKDWTQESMDTFDNMGKRLAGDVAPGTEIALNEQDRQTYRQAYVKDYETGSTIQDYFDRLLGADVAEAYKEINVADAQELTTFEEHLFVMKGLGQISYRKYKDLLKKYKDAGDDFKLSEADKELVVGPMKPVRVSNDPMYVNGMAAVDVRNYIKSSSFPLLPEFTKGTGLDSIRKSMEEEGVHRLAYESAAKLGSPKEMLDITSVLENGEEIPVGFLTASSKELPRKGFRIQQGVPYKESKTKINDGTQQRKLLFSNLLDVAGFKHKDFKGPVKGSELFDRYNEIYHKIFKDAYNQFNAEMTNKDGSVNKKKLSKSLIKEAIERNFPLNDVYALGIDEATGDFKIPLWSAISANKYEALINGIVDSRIRQQEMRGNSFVLGSDAGTAPIAGWDTLSPQQKNSIIRTKKFDPEKGLQAVDQDGYAQIMVQNRIESKSGEFINLADYVDDNGLIDSFLLPDEVLEGAGFRIPTQGHNSMAKVRIVGFLPSQMGDLIIAPREWVVQMGSDFDVDKFYIRFHNTFTSDGLVGKSDTGRKGDENDLLDIALSVLNHSVKDKDGKEMSPVQKQVAAPLEFGRLKGGRGEGVSSDRLNVARTIDNAKPKENIKFNPISPTYQRKRYANALAGKAGTGVFSLDSTLNASMQGKDITLVLEDENVSALISNLFKFGDHAFDPNKNSLSDIYTLSGNGRYKSDVIAAYQSAAVDNEKEQILDKLNINNETFAALRALNQVGFEEDIVGAFLNQPIIIDYVNELKMLKSQQKGSAAKLSSLAADAVLSKYDTGSIKFEDLAKDADSESFYAEKAAEGFKSMLESIKDQGKNGYVQRAYLEKFLKLSEVGSMLQEIQVAINADSSGISPLTLENIEKESRIQGLRRIGSDIKIKGAEKLIGEYTTSKNKAEEDGGYIATKQQTPKGLKTVYIKPTTINGFASVYGLFVANKITDQVFKFGSSSKLTHGAFDNLLKFVRADDDSIEAVARKKNRIWKELKKYVYSGAFSEIPSIDRMELFYDTENNESLATKVNRFQKMPMFKNNTFIQRLKAYTNDGTKPSTITYNAASVENQNEDNIYAGFIHLVTDPQVIEEGYTTKDLANDLVKLSFLEGGIQEASQFVRYVPGSYLTKGSFMSHVKSIRWESRTALYKGNTVEANAPNEFTRQYIQHYPWEALVLEGSNELHSKTKVGHPVVALNKESVGKYVNFDSNGKPVFPKFISFKNSKSNRGFTLYEYKKYETVNGDIQENYIKIDTLGTRGMNEYTFKDESVGTIGKNKAYTKASQGAQDQAGMMDALFEQDAATAAAKKEGEEKGEVKVFNKNDEPTPIGEKYGLSDINKNPDKAGALTEVLMNISKSKEASDSYKYLAETFAKLFEKFNIKVETEALGKKPGAGSAGRSVYPVGNTKGERSIIIDLAHNDNKSDFGFQHTFLHEATHHATIMGVDENVKEVGGKVVYTGPAKKLKAIYDVYSREVANGNIKLDEYLTNVHNYISTNHTNKSGVENARRLLQEFSAFALANPQFQEALKDTSYRKENASYWDKLVKAWTDILSSLGIKSNERSLRSSAVAETMNLIAVSQNYAPVTAVKQDAKSIEKRVGDKFLGNYAKDRAADESDFFSTEGASEGEIMFDLISLGIQGNPKGLKLFKKGDGLSEQVYLAAGLTEDATYNQKQKAKALYSNYIVDEFPNTRISAKFVGSEEDMKKFTEHLEQIRENVLGHLGLKKHILALVPLIKAGIISEKELDNLIAQNKLC